MNQQKKSYSQTVERGNAFVWRWALIALFVHFTIAVPYFDPVENNRIGKSQKLIDDVIRVKEAKLEALEKAERDGPQGLSIRESILSLQQAYLVLEGSKQSRGFSIPVIGIQLNKNAIMLFYPALVFGGLFWLLRLRSQLIKLADNQLKFPLWAAPIPRKYTVASVPGWILTNAVAITAHAVIVAWVLAFVWEARRGTRPEFFVIVTATIVVLLMQYIVSIVETAKVDFRRGEDTRNAAEVS